MSHSTVKDVKVRILSDTHEHAGEVVPMGTVLDVSPRTGTHLINIGVAELVPVGADEETETSEAGGAE